MLLTFSVFLSSALSSVYPAALPASLAGDPLWREDDEKRSVLQVRLQIYLETGPIDSINSYNSRCIRGNHGGCFHRISTKSKVKVEKSPEEGLNEDEDVQMEKARVKEALSCRSCEEVSRCLSPRTEPHMQT